MKNIPQQGATMPHKEQTVNELTTLQCNALQTCHVQLFSA